MMPIYLVEDLFAEVGAKDAARLVNAVRPASAVRHVVGNRFVVTTPSALDMHRLGRLGVDIEVAGDAGDDSDPEPAPASAVAQPADGPQEHDATPIPAGWQVEPADDAPATVKESLTVDDEPAAAPAPSRGRSVLDAIAADDGDDALSDAAFYGSASED